MQTSGVLKEGVGRCSPPAAGQEDLSGAAGGDDSDAHREFQLIAGINRSLSNMVRVGAFRDEMLAQIKLWRFRLPGLRERVKDIEPNLGHELEQYGRSAGQHVTFSREALLSAGSENRVGPTQLSWGQWLGFGRGMDCAVAAGSPCDERVPGCTERSSRGGRVARAVEAA